MVYLWPISCLNLWNPKTRTWSSFDLVVLASPSTIIPPRYRLSFCYETRWGWLALELSVIFECKQGLYLSQEEESVISIIGNYILFPFAQFLVTWWYCCLLHMTIQKQLSWLKLRLAKPILQTTLNNIGGAGSDLFYIASRVMGLASTGLTWFVVCSLFNFAIVIP